MKNLLLNLVGNGALTIILLVLIAQIECAESYFDTDMKFGALTVGLFFTSWMINRWIGTFLKSFTESH